eukprot:g4912.t1
MQESGYIRVDERTGKELFYLFAPQRAADGMASGDGDGDGKGPLIVWLAGGPGCSSLLPFLTENGPCRVTPVLTTVNNPHSWTGAASVLWLEQNVGVGFSYARDAAGYEPPRGGAVDAATHDTLVFLQKWLELHPKYRHRDLFLFGSGFAGHFVPAVGRAVLQSNQAFANTPIQLRGVAIGNGDADQFEIFRSYAAYLRWASKRYKVSILSNAQQHNMEQFSTQCFDMLRRCDDAARAAEPKLDGGDPSSVLSPQAARRASDRTCMRAARTCQSVFFSPIAAARRDAQDIRKPCRPTKEGGPTGCRPHETERKFLRMRATRHSLGVSPRSSEWQLCNVTVNQAFAGEWAQSWRASSDVAALLAAGVRVLVYAGDADYMGNWMGNSQFTRQIEWHSSAAFRAQPEQVWRGQGELADGSQSEFAPLGIGRGFGGLDFVRVFRSGSTVGADQPSAALQMVRKFVAGQAFFPEFKTKAPTPPPASEQKLPPDFYPGGRTPAPTPPGATDCLMSPFSGYTPVAGTRAGR